MDFKVMTFNILFGGGDTLRFQQVLETIAKTTPDFLILQECLDWQENNRLEQVAEILAVKPTKEFAYLALARPRGSGSRYNIALFSRFPMIETTTYNDDAFLGHCIVRTSIDWLGSKINIFATHFDSHNENLRFVEARYLRSLIDKKDFEQGYYLLAGDLNSLSTKDPYPTNLAELLEKSQTSKYHLPPRFDVISELESFGWIDTLYYKQVIQPNWVTAIRSRGDIRIDYRTDYIFASAKLAQKLNRVKIIDCGNASDHFPVLGTFEKEKASNNTR
ncbi:MAG: endonuclease/exonuclease/phosphatase family protein [Blastocatellia bacterium]|nr:endonuclease/exonuclease/phosphatase family protein [Blastocatellia bacterium]